MEHAAASTRQDNLMAHILVYREKDYWIAHCLEFDLLADSQTPQKAVSILSGVINTHIEYLKKNNAMHQLYNPAPKKYWKLLVDAEPVGEITLMAHPTGQRPKKLKLEKIFKIPFHEMARLNLEYRQSLTV